MAEVEDSEGVGSFLRSLGATDEQVTTARRVGHLAGLASDLVLAEGADLSAIDLAAQAGVDLDLVLNLWHMLGVAVLDVHQPMFTGRDASFTAYAIQIKPVGAHGDELFRILGTSLARVAEAAVSLYVQTVEPQMASADVDVVVWAKDLAETTAVALKLGDSMGTIFAHHMRDAVDRQRAAQKKAPERSLFRLAIGFVDLVGFTPLSQHAAPADLLELIGRFDARAFEVASGLNGRIVKHIGDEVMFVALDADAACSIAQALTCTHDKGIEPRGGVAYGDVITRYGDYYGPVVNLASRLADLAVPQEVLADAATASAATDAFEFRPAGHRLLKGFEEPVEVFSLRAPATEAADRTPV